MLFKFVPGGFLRSDTLEHFKFKLEKTIGIQKPTGKVRKIKPSLHLHYLAPVSKDFLPTIWWEFFQKDLYILIWKTFKNSLVFFFKRYLQSLIYIILYLWK